MIITIPSTDSAAASRVTERAEARADPRGRSSTPDDRPVPGHGSAGAGAPSGRATSLTVRLLFPRDEPLETDPPRPLHQDRAAVLHEAREGLARGAGGRVDRAAGGAREAFFEVVAELADIDDVGEPRLRRFPPEVPVELAS